VGICSPFFVTQNPSRYFLVMLLITKAESKNWYLTLTEKVTIANPKFLFSMTHLLTDQVVNKILTDISTQTERYNKFAVVEGTTFTLLNGEYEYKVYAQTSAVNTNPDLANELVETGVLKCQLVDQPEVFYSPA
jgi:hypothetical protein